MKQLFSYGQDGEKHVYEGDVFITRRIDSESAARLDEIDKRFDQLDTAVDDEAPIKILTPLQYALIACGVVIIALMIYITSAFDSLNQGFEENPALALVVAAACLVAVIITVIDKRKQKAVEQADPTRGETAALIDEEDKLMNQAFDTLGIPADDEVLDILTPPDGQDIAELPCVDTLCLTLFEDADTLFLTDFRVRYDFKKSYFTSVTHVDRPITVVKPFKLYDKKIIKAYGIQETENGYVIPSYDLFTLSTEHGDYTLALPCYDGKLLAEKLGLQN